MSASLLVTSRSRHLIPSHSSLVTSNPWPTKKQERKNVPAFLDDQTLICYTYVQGTIFLREEMFVLKERKQHVQYWNESAGAGEDRRCG